MDHVEYAYTEGLDDTAIEERLAGAETGVLALADAGEAYAIPLAHYYDGDSLFFRLGMTASSRKRRFLSSTTTATYVLYGTEPTAEPRALDSWSIIARGSLSEVPAADHDRFDTAAINERFAPIRVFGEDIDAIDVAIVELDIESLTGRRTLELLADDAGATEG